MSGESIPVRVNVPAGAWWRMTEMAKKHHVRVGDLVWELARRQLKGSAFEAQVESDAVVADDRRREAGTPWTGEESEWLRELHGEGLSDRAISERMGRSRTVVVARRRTLGLGAVGKPWKRTVWTEETVAELRRLHELGWSDISISEAIGCDHTTVGDKRRALGLPTNFRGRGRSS